MSRSHTRLDELIRDVPGMGDRGREDNRLASFRQAMPVGDDIADELRPVHAGGELVFDIVAGPDLDALKVGRGRRIDHGRHQKAQVNELTDSGALDHRVKHVAQASAIAPARRCGQPDDCGAWVGIEQLPIGAGPDPVRLVDNQQICPGQIKLRAADCASMDCLNAADLDGRIVIAAGIVGKDRARPEAGAIELPISLVDELATVRHHQGGFALCNGPGNQGRGNDGLAGAGRSDEQDAPRAIRHHRLQLRNDV